MNEFPGKFMEAMNEASHSDVVPLNVTEYLDYLGHLGIKESDFPKVTPLFQRRIWERYKAGSGPEKLSQVIEELKKADRRFHVDGGSWTNDISWIYGYENVLGPMEKASALFDAKVRRAGVSPGEHRYRNALFHLLTAQTSCFRYWGQGRWTDYGREICRRAIEILTHDF